MNQFSVINHFSGESYIQSASTVLAHFEKCLVADGAACFADLTNSFYNFCGWQGLRKISEL